MARAILPLLHAMESTTNIPHINIKHEQKNSPQAWSTLAASHLYNISAMSRRNTTTQHHQSTLYRPTQNFPLLSRIPAVLPSETYAAPRTDSQAFLDRFADPTANRTLPEPPRPEQT